jgi:magnesium-transporting ATPase (P-type)
VRIYVKGAPEYTLPFCNRTVNLENQPIDLDGSTKQQLLEDVVSAEMAANGLKVISYAFKEINLSTMEELM